MIGETIDDRYTITRALGEGGMGSVFEARHTGTGRRVALKVITGDLAKNPSIKARFEIEARAAGIIESKHIAHVLDVGRDVQRDLPYMVMELLLGEDLQTLFHRLGPLPPDLVARIGAQACLGLSKAHAARIIHRDIKPANIFLADQDDGDIVCKILDFGIAKIKMDEAQREANTLTVTGSLLGTPLYMAPEQATGEKVIDHRADVWSLGVVLFQALTGKTPHHQIDALGKLIIYICSIPAPPVQELAPWVSPELAQIVGRALSIDARGRFQTSDEMLVALKTLVPDGHSLKKSMVVPLGDEARGRAAPKATLRSSEVDLAPFRPAFAAPTPAIVEPPRMPSFTPAGTLASPDVDVAAATMETGFLPPGVDAGGNLLRTTSATSSELRRTGKSGARDRTMSRIPLVAGAFVVGAALVGGVALTQTGPSKATASSASPAASSPQTLPMALSVDVAPAPSVEPSAPAPEPSAEATATPAPAASSATSAAPVRPRGGGPFVPKGLPAGPSKGGGRPPAKKPIDPLQHM